MKLSDFSYELPQELIAQHPAEPRDTARLMLYDKKTGETENKIFRQLTDELHQGDVLVFNDSKVIPARLHGARVPTGGKVEVLLLTPVGEDRWEVLVKPGKKALPGSTLSFGERLTGVVEDRTDYGGRVIHFTYDGVFDHIIESAKCLCRRIFMKNPKILTTTKLFMLEKKGLLPLLRRGFTLRMNCWKKSGTKE